MTRQPPPRRDRAGRPRPGRRRARVLAGAAAFATVAATLVPAAAAASTSPAGAAPMGAPVSAATAPVADVRLPSAPTFEQLLADLAAALTIPQLLADAATAKTGYLAARVAWRLGRHCDAARHLRIASDALQHALSIAPEALRPPIRRLAEGTLRLEQDVVAAAPEGCDRPDVYAVDSQLRPSVATAPDELTGEALPIGALDDGDGAPMEFVSNAILLETDDPARVAAFRARFGGTVTDEITAHPGDAGEVATQHVIRMDPARLLDPARLPADMAALDPGWSGDVHLASDAQTIRLLATAARAQLEGFEVELDLLGGADGIPDGRTDELADGATAPATYDEDAFTWDYFRDGTTQDIEVTNAWQHLASAGALSNKVKLAVIDSGFSRGHTDDLPSSLQAIDTGPSTNAWDQGRGRDQWHGTKVADAFAGQVDNKQAAAGPAGPVAGHTVLVNHGGLTIRSYTRAIRRINRADVDIVNVSWSIRFKAHFGRLAIKRFDRVLRRAHGDGMLVFASAGNDGRDIDAQKCRSVRGCRERDLIAPCESDRVICVGALGRNNRRRATTTDGWATGSNFGQRDVDIWAPGTDIWVTQSPNCGCQEVETENGTSFASPFAAGVAALIKAANPSFGPSQIWEVMRDTARPGSETAVPRVVHAGAAVRAALGGPTVSISAPRPGQSFAYADTVTGGLQVDGGDGIPDIVWRVGETPIGRGPTARLDLPVGTSVVTATATFADGTVRTAAVRARREMPPSTWTITSPAPGAQIAARIARDEGIRFTSDPAGPDVQWFLDGQATPFATGAGVVQAFPGIAEGPHTAEARVAARDGSGTVSRTVVFTVVPDPPERTTVAVSSPQPGAEIWALGLADVPLQASGTDLVPVPAGGCPPGSAPAGAECASPTTGTFEWTVQSVRTGQVVARASGPSATVSIGSDNYVAVVTIVKNGTTVATASVPFAVFQQPI